MIGKLLAVLAVVIALLAGVWIGGHPAKLPDAIQDAFIDENVSLQAEASELIEENYYRKVSPAQLSDASVNGMVRSLKSRFSAYFTPKQNKLFEEATSGAFSGVGLNVFEIPRGLQVSAVFPKSPAKRAGIKPGDRITKVNGKSIAGESSSVSTARIKGPPGTFVTLTVRRGGKAKQYKLRRARISVPVVAGRMRTVAGQKLGAIGVASFTSGVHGAVGEQIIKQTRRGAQGFVLDLRGNGGGLLDEAVLVSSLFIAKGKIVTTEGRTKPKQVYNATGDILTRKPVVVLVDRGTASASEIVTAALEQRLGSPVVGRRTFGKGVFGQVFPLSNDGALDLIVGDYFTPNGTSINGKGIKPTVPLSKKVSANPREALNRALVVLAGEVQQDRSGRRR